MPENAISRENPERAIRALLAAEVEAETFPGAQLSVVGPGINLDISIGATGSSGLAETTAVTDETHFDLASLTKVLCTSILLMRAVEEGRVSLHAPISRFFPELPGSGQMTVAHLATHRAGLVAHHQFFSTLWSEGISTGPKARRRLFEELCLLPLAGEPGIATVYSDPGFILLGWLIERVFDDTLDNLFRRIVTTPLGLERLRFGPVPQPVAATESDENSEMLWGCVHDENARALGGIEGHAGLFGTAADAMKLVRHLELVRKGGAGIVRRETVGEFWMSRAGQRFTLGWDTPTEPSSSGRFTTRSGAVGHLGFTGCSVWHDYVRDVTVVLVSNRVHPTRENDQLRVLRPRLHDVVNQTMFGADR